MARLKVKQISDFTSAVQNLLASDLSGLEAVDSAQSVLIANNASAIADNDSDISDLVAVDSAQSLLIAANASDIATNEGSITDLVAVDSAQSALIVKLQSDVTANDSDISDLEAVDSAQSVLISDNATAIANITDIQGTDLDQFSEVIAYVNSVSSTGDLDLTSFIATSNANDSTHSTAIAALQAVDSTQSSGIAANASDIKDLKDQADANDADNLVLHTESSTQSTAIAANLASIGALENSVDSLESIDSLLSAEIAALETTVSEGDTMLHQEGTFVDVVRFTLPLAVKFGVNDDIHVHVNGHTIKPFTAEYGDEVAKSADHGWYSVNGTAFEFVNIGYDLEPSDVVYVQAIKG